MDQDLPEVRVFAFEDVAERVGIIGLQQEGIEPCAYLNLIGSGSAWADPDLDGDPDLFATNHGGPNFFYLNQGDLNGDGLPDFTDIAGALGMQQADAFSHAAVFIDYDNDGDQDLFVSSQNLGNTLWQNQLMESGSMSFVDVADRAGLRDEGRTVTAAWGDLDQDGFLDTYFAKHASCLLDVDPMPPDRLFHSLADGTFEDWSRYLCADRTTDCGAVTGLGFSAAFLDHDNDGDPDIYLANDATHGGVRNRHWRNDGPDGVGGWILTESSAQLGTNARINGMGLGVGDLDNDGWLDLAVSNIAESIVLRNLRDGSYEDLTLSCGVFSATYLLVGWGTEFFDADSDGWLDLFFANGGLYGTYPMPNTFLRNNRDRTFADLSVESGLNGPRRGRNTSTVDFDQDGSPDLFVGNLFQQPYLYHNLSRQQGSTQNWLTVTLEGTRSNRDGIGARLTLFTPGMQQIREVTSGAGHGGGAERLVHFGLGASVNGRLRVRWPSGVVQEVGLVQSGTRLHVIEP